MDAPEIGSDIYVPTMLYLSRGRDDISGGKGKVSKTEHKWNSLWVEVDELPDRSFNWDVIARDQEKMAKEYGDRRCRPDPDDHPSANTGGL